MPYLKALKTLVKPIGMHEVVVGSVGADGVVVSSVDVDARAVIQPNHVVLDQISGKKSKLMV